MRGAFDFFSSRGLSNFKRMPRLPVVAVAAAGSTTADAAVIPYAGIVHATGADATKGVMLPTPQGEGDWCFVKNSTAANAVLKVYPPTGKKINDGTADAALSMAAKTSALFVSIDGTGWTSLPLLPS
jgi:hypothetical protein